MTTMIKVVVGTTIVVSMVVVVTFFAVPTLVVWSRNP